MANELLTSDFLTRTIVGLGKHQLDLLAKTTIKHVFKQNPLHVDGKGDGGADFLPTLSPHGAVGVVYQVTIQDAGWQEKAIEDAAKAKKAYHSPLFYFITSRNHEYLSLLQLENKIKLEVGLQATCWGARELSQVILGSGSAREILSGVVPDLPIHTSTAPNRREILLHTYMAISDDAVDLRDSILDDSLLFAAYEADGQLTRDELVSAAQEFFGPNDDKSPQLASRLDSLLAKKRLKTENKRLFLAADVKSSLQIAKGVYSLESAGLRATVRDILKKHGGIVDEKATDAKIDEIGVMLSRRFISTQLRTARDALIELSIGGLVQEETSSEQDLRAAIANLGIRAKQVEACLIELAEELSKNPLVIKLSRGALHWALQGQSPVSKCKVFGVGSWRDVIVALDASVAIPYLCACMFTETTGRFSTSSLRSIERLRGLGARLVILESHLSECAAHLAKAVNFIDLEKDLGSALSHSRNGYVSHYEQLREAGVYTGSLTDYLSTFSRVTRHRYSSLIEHTKRLTPDIRSLLREYEIDPVGGSGYLAETQELIDQISDYLKQNQKVKPAILIKNDATALAELRAEVASRGQLPMLLSWDHLIIKFSRDVLQGSHGMLLSPDHALDLLPPDGNYDRDRLVSLSHRLASVNDAASEAVGRIVDNIVDLANGKDMDVALRKKIGEFRQALVQRMDLSDESFETWAKEQWDSFRHVLEDAPDKTADQENTNAPEQ